VKTTGTPTLSDEAYEVVRQRILRGELSMGSVVSRRRIAAELGMSFLPVSEALQRLEAEGYLESRPRAGTRVRIPSAEDVRGHYVVREALETQAARLFAEVATKSEREEMKKLAARVDALWRQPDRIQYLRMHERLHFRIAECARCPALSTAIAQTHSLASTWLCVMQQPKAETLVRPHQDLVECLCSENPDEATEGMRAHVLLSRERTMLRMEPYFQLREQRGEKFLRTDNQLKRKLPSA
jgi:DNA-binding GntR family transcriptional regulator